MARYEDLTWWMRRPSGMTDETAARTYGTLSPLAGSLSQTAAIDYGADQGIGTGPGRKLVLRDPEELARVASEVAKLQAPANPWAGRVMGDTIGGAQSNWLSRRGQDLSAIASARAFAEQQRQFNANQAAVQQNRQDQLAANAWSRNLSAQSRQAEIDQRAQDSMLDYLASLARTDTESRSAMRRIAQQQQQALLSGATRQAAAAGSAQNAADLGELLRARAEITASLQDAEDELKLRQDAGTFSPKNFLPDGTAGPIGYDQDLIEQVQQLRRAALMNEADIQAGKLSKGTGAGVAALPAASVSPFPADGGGISPVLLQQLLTQSGQRSRATGPTSMLTPTQRLLMERGNIMGTNPWRGNYGASSAYGSNDAEQTRLSDRFSQGYSPVIPTAPAAVASIAPVFQGGPTGGLPAVAPVDSEPVTTLRLTPSGQLEPIGQYGPNLPTNIEQTPEFIQWSQMLSNLERNRDTRAADPLMAPLAGEIARYLSIDPSQIGGSSLYRTPGGQVSSALRSGSGPIAEQVQKIPVQIMREMLRSALREYQRNSTAPLPRVKFNI